MQNLKRGDVRSSDGKIFWCRRKSNGYETWLAPEGFKARQAHTAEVARKRRVEHPEKVLGESKRYREANREKCNATTREWAIKNAGRRRSTNAAWYEHNKERLRAVRRAWEERNKEKRRELTRAQDAKRKANPRLLALKRLRLRMAYSAGRLKASKLVTRAQSKDAAQFLAWLAKRLGIDILDTYHVDHLFPISSFDLNDPEQAARVNIPENVRWLTAEENQRKGDSLPSPDEVRRHLELVREWRVERA